jgi:hypothetical protein
MPIGTSRVLSMSMFVFPIYQLRQVLFRDQLVELCLVASMLNTPVRFKEYLIRLQAEDTDLLVTEYPFYLWKEKTSELFGQFQGGPHPRFSSCLNSLLACFAKTQGDEDVQRLE